MIPTRTLVVDDFAPFRRYICTLLQQKPKLHIVGEAADGLSAVRMAIALGPDLIVLDLNLPKLNGVEAARQIRKALPGCKILVISQESGGEIVEEIFALGARGYVLKTVVRAELLLAVDAVLQGNLFRSHGLGLVAKMDLPGDARNV